MSYYSSLSAMEANVALDKTKEIIAVLLSLHAAHSYILLTANLDDVHSLIKQLAFSSVANQLHDIVGRASTIFNKHQEEYNLENKAQMRADPKLDEDRPPTNGGQKKLETSEKSQPNPTTTTEPTTPNKPEPTKKTDAKTANDKEVWRPDEKALTAELNAQTSDSSSESSDEANAIHSQNYRIMRRHNPDIAELGRNASFYLNSINKVFEGV